MKRALVLFSKGLDSILAVKIMQAQGFCVTALHFVVPFIQDKKEERSQATAKKFAKMLGAGLKIVHLEDDYLEILKNPRYGYGRNLNPCIDCKILMFKKAKEIMCSMGLNFIVTGEVCGQRPKSQNRRIFAMMDKRAEATGLILRPLSAKILPPTSAEDAGLVDRGKLYDFYGRGRSVQIKLAGEFGIEEYPQPGGGCLLTDASFCGRVKDLIKHDELNMESAALLKLGRHFRLSPSVKVVVGRDEDENNRLKRLAGEGDVYFETVDLAGPEALMRGAFSKEDKLCAAGIVAQYTLGGKPVKVKVIEGTSKTGKGTVISVKGVGSGLLKQLMI